ncbi:hypothetical protein UY3_17186 [Chelonia mydas]|uniref:Uncharacterized protein n=1 Tax=Chelonia mydas TaxID=8469 RepID=M7AS74_CHEMY|nr:hypothetical protein UY3_17186 [Chelonia mydas]
MGQSRIPEEIRKSPVKPSGKGSKRKQDDVALEEHQSWVEILQQELPEEDEAEDSTYEVPELPGPSRLLQKEKWWLANRQLSFQSREMGQKYWHDECCSTDCSRFHVNHQTQSETDSEEYRSQNDTETDLEFEEKDGVLVLKASPSLQLWENIMMALDQSMAAPNDHFTKVNQARCGFMEPAAAEMSQFSVAVPAAAGKPFYLDSTLSWSDLEWRISWAVVVGAGALGSEHPHTPKSSAHRVHNLGSHA